MVLSLLPILSPPVRKDYSLRFQYLRMEDQVCPDISHAVQQLGHRAAQTQKGRIPSEQAMKTPEPLSIGHRYPGDVVIEPLFPSAPRRRSKEGLQHLSHLKAGSDAPAQCASKQALSLSQAFQELRKLELVGRLR